MCRKICAVLIMLQCFLQAAIAQDVAKIKGILTSISHNYDTSANLSFGIRFTNVTELKGEKPVSDNIEGKYAMQGKKAFYVLGNIEVMQNDSFFIAVYPDDNFLLVSKPKGNGNNQFFPFRETMDSLLRLSAERYSIEHTINKSEKKGTIVFAAKDTAEKVNEFRIEYNSSIGLITSLRYLYMEYKEAKEDYKLETPTLVLNKKILQIDFFDYNHQIVDAALLQERNYIVFEAGECKLVDKYKDYKLYYNPPPVVTEE
jgi:hypothetical protein